MAHALLTCIAIQPVHGYITLSQVDTPVYLQTLAMIKYHLDEAFGKL